MPKALSPREPPERLKSTVKEIWGSPRKTQSHFQVVALGRGYTIKAGASRRKKLESSRGRIPRAIPPTNITIQNEVDKRDEQD